MDFKSFFPVWGKLTAAQQNLISGHLTSRTISKGTVIHNGSMDCTGLLLVKSGQLRAYILSDEEGSLPSTDCLSGTCACFPPLVSCDPFSLR